VHSCRFLLDSFHGVDSLLRHEIKRMLFVSLIKLLLVVYMQSSTNYTTWRHSNIDS